METSPTSALVALRPGRLRGLWEMRKIDIEDLFRLCNDSARIKTYFEEDAHKDHVMSAESRTTNQKNMADHGRHFTELSLPMCRLQCDEIVRALDQPVTGAGYGAMMGVLQKRMEHEVSLTQGFLLTTAETRLYDQKAPLFGDSVSTRFPGANDDIAEAGKCLALGRGTACVMHLMRVMEVGLRSLAKPLDIPYAPSWESYLQQIAAKIALPYAKKPRKWRKSEPFFRDVSGDLISVKQAWRNPSMHVVSKFTPEEADDVLRAVRRFMQRIADGLPAEKPKKAAKK